MIFRCQSPPYIRLPACALLYKIVHHLYNPSAVAPSLLIAVDAVQQVEDRVGLPRAVVMRGQVQEHTSCLSASGVPKLARRGSPRQRVGKAEAHKAGVRHHEDTAFPVGNTDRIRIAGVHQLLTVRFELVCVNLRDEWGCGVGEKAVWASIHTDGF